VTSEQVTASLLRDGTLGQSRPPVHATVLKLHGLLSHEPYSPWTGLSQSTGGDHWEVRLSSRLGLIRALRDTATVEDYVAFIEDWLKPHPVPVVPHVINALDLPNAADYLMWCGRSRPAGACSRTFTSAVARGSRKRATPRTGSTPLPAPWRPVRWL
jgi:hypothetical protein